MVVYGLVLGRSEPTFGCFFRGFYASVGCSIRYAFALFFTSISGFSLLVFIVFMGSVFLPFLPIFSLDLCFLCSGCSVIDCNGFVLVGLIIYFSLSVLGIGFGWVRVACILYFVCVGEWVIG